MIINGTNYSVIDVYDLPITVETDDWFSEEPADVAGVMIIK